MWNMFTLGKEAGRKEALQALPITQVQPRQAAVVHLPPGEWTRHYRASHLIVPPIVRENTDPIDPEKDFPKWLTAMTPAEIAQVPTIRDLTPKLDPDDTEEVPAILKLIYQDRQQRRQAG